jgi:predicted nucleic acid-binding protein
VIIVSNSSPIISLARIRQLDLIRSLFGRIHTTPTVRIETLEQCSDPGEALHIGEAFESFFDVVEPRLRPVFARTLDDGEESVIALALELKADLVLLDDKKAVKEARELKLAPVSTREMILEAEARGIIPSASAVIQRLSERRVFV